MRKRHYERNDVESECKVTGTENTNETLPQS